MELSVKAHSEREFGMGQTTVQGRPIEFFVRGADEISLNLSKSKMEIKSKIALKNGNDLGDGDSVGPLNRLKPMGVLIRLGPKGGTKCTPDKNLC